MKSLSLASALARDLLALLAETFMAVMLFSTRSPRICDFSSRVPSSLHHTVRSLARIYDFAHPLLPEFNTIRL
ncbi:hypothetical protein BD769DRAFT_850467 [Suillus cothurnatus]|nr:hypothetical protein BD769DRAFT_850467 [Suillus cothurnatus]